MKLKDLTPENYQCALLTCPSIYEITPDSEQCLVVLPVLVYMILKIPI